jgi:periplasmic copper chaperone A
MSFAVRLALALLLLSPATAFAHSFTKGDIAVGHPWARATPEGAAVGVGYLKITNKGKEADRLTGGAMDGADKIEIHEMKMDGDVMKMRQLTEGLEIKPGETVELKPGANHLMFTGLKKTILQGPDLKATLNFAKAGAIDVEFRVEAVGATESMDHKHAE